MALLDAFIKFQSHSILQNLTLDALVTLTRLLGHLKRDVLQPQPPSQSASDTPPLNLPAPILTFLSSVIGVLEADVKDFWSVMKKDIWETPLSPLTDEDYRLFKTFGWPLGITAISIYPVHDTCQNVRCENHGVILKKEYRKKAVVFMGNNTVQPAWNTSIYCRGCKTSYHKNYAVQAGQRIYHANVPELIQVGEHQFVERKLAYTWRSNMLYGWFSASNASRAFESAATTQEFLPSEWGLNDVLRTDHVWDSFIILGLLEDAKLRGHLLTVPHTGDQSERFKFAMEERNEWIVLNGQPDAVQHTCDKCMRVFLMPDGTYKKSQAIVGDGISIGRPCCGVFRCTEALSSNRNRFCNTHLALNDICAIVDCQNPVVSSTVISPTTGLSKVVKKKTCALSIHQAIEKKHGERSTGSFLYKERLQRARIAHPSDTFGSTGLDGDDLDEDVTEYVVAEKPLVPGSSSQADRGATSSNGAASEAAGDDIDIRINIQKNTGSVGVLDDGTTGVTTGSNLSSRSPRTASVLTTNPIQSVQPFQSSLPSPAQVDNVVSTNVPCPTKSLTGNRPILKAQFGRRRTHNEQTLVRPCGVIFARATMYGAEAVSNFLVMVKNAFSVPGASKPEHIFYDTNCLARQQAESDPWFKDIGMCVDAWHFRNKHATTHEYCQLHCNPAIYPELMDGESAWFFNTSIAEQTNAWFGGYHSMCREMLPHKFDFFLDEMIRLRNIDIICRLDKGGYHPAIL
ncbi:hypothetical protein CVT24_012157 [Panaeolus cyanescens]|uniref:CxC5 like cysteine cluster associated with KDZ domain-containing protein n=1 Tax=Panaeolus cyanescens TaxID=181874 RepID=A0A409YJ01_9AGAR|nr:hypothetical protein CVT24_012157 [Panaeolus cyanescens]